MALLSVLLFSIRWLGAFPAVLPMALGFVLVNLRYFKLSRAEIHATLIVLLPDGRSGHGVLPAREISDMADRYDPAEIEPNGRRGGRRRGCTARRGSRRGRSTTS